MAHAEDLRVGAIELRQRVERRQQVKSLVMAEIRPAGQVTMSDGEEADPNAATKAA